MVVSCPVPLLLIATTVKLYVAPVIRLSNNNSVSAVTVMFIWLDESLLNWYFIKYPVITPFWSFSAGGSHLKMADSLDGAALRLRGGPLGTVYQWYHTLILHGNLQITTKQTLWIKNESIKIFIIVIPDSALKPIAINRYT